MIVSIDYSALELRCLAGAPKSRHYPDTLTLLAARIFNKPVHAVTRAERTEAKFVAFFELYSTPVREKLT